MKKSRNIQSGFTMIELMIVVAIVAIVASIGLPSYHEHVKKSKRSDAKIALLKYAQLQESYFVQNLSYAKSLKNEDGGLRVSGTNLTMISEHDLYTISLTSEPSGCTGLAGANACRTFTLNAVAKNGQAADKDCIGFDINNVGRKRAKTYTDTSYTTGQGQTCWSSRITPDPG